MKTSDESDLLEKLASSLIKQEQKKDRKVDATMVIYMGVPMWRSVRDIAREYLSEVLADSKIRALYSSSEIRELLQETLGDLESRGEITPENIREYFVDDLKQEAEE